MTPPWVRGRGGRRGLRERGRTAHTVQAMTDAVALISVASSGAVALGGLFVTYRSGREQRTHEAHQAFEARAWEVKSKGLFSSISAARSLIDTVTSPSKFRRQELGLVVPGALDRLNEALPAVESYASSECRSAFQALRSLLLSAKTDLLAPMRIADIRQAKERAIDAVDFAKAADLRDQERAVYAKATADLGIDSDEVRSRAETLIEAARASLKG